MNKHKTEIEQYKEWLESHKTKSNEQLKNALKDCHYDNLDQYENFFSEAYENGLYAASIYQTLIEREKAKMFDEAYFQKWRSNTFEVANVPENKTRLSDSGICFTGCPEYKSFIVFKEGGFLAKRTDDLYELWIQKDTLVSESRTHLESILYKFLCNEYS